MHNSPRAAAVAQFVDPKTDLLQQKWILGFITAEETTYYLERKQWIHSAIEIQETKLGLRACKGPEPPRKKMTKPIKDAARRAPLEGAILNDLCK